MRGNNHGFAFLPLSFTRGIISICLGFKLEFDQRHLSLSVSSQSEQSNFVNVDYKNKSVECCKMSTN